MENNENIQEFSLDEIMQEFSGDAPETEGVEIPPEELENFELDPIPEETQQEEAPPAVTTDTIRLDDLSQVISQSDYDGDAVREMPPLEPEEEAAAEEAAEPEDSGESFDVDSSQIPTPPPIIFRSRLRELKKQLVAGPERRYYELAEIGLGRVQAAIFACLLITLICGGSTVLYALGMVPENRLRLMAFGQILAMMLSTLMGCYVLMDGFVDLFRARFTLNSLLLVTLIACGVDAVFCLQELRVPCCAAFCLEMTMALYNRYLRRSSEMSQMDTLRKAVRLDGIVKSEDYFDGHPGFLRSEGKVEDFMDNYAAVTGPERTQNIFALISLAGCCGIAALAATLHGISLGVQILATSLLVAVPASIFVAQSRPMAILQRRMHMVGTVICGWQGVKKLCAKAAYPLTDRDMFPIGSTKLNGVKFFGDLEPDRVVTLAAGLIHASGSSLDPLFTQLLKSRGGRLQPAVNYRTYPGGGIGGEVMGTPVLMGPAEFLQDMGVEIPGGTMVSQAIYCSIDGQFSAVFAFNYSRMKSAAAGLVTLSSCRKLFPVVLSTDFMITESFLRGKFGIKTKRFSFPDPETRRDLAEKTADPELVAGALTTQENLSSAAYAVTGARALRTSCRLGTAVHIAAGITGMLIMLVLAYLGSTELLTPMNVLLYQLVWMLPGLLFTEWARAV